jgi:hypothetical protein
MMKKKRIDEKMGGGSRIGLGGMNSDGPFNPRYNTQNPSGYHSGGYRGNADTIHSQRMGLASTIDEEEEKDEEIEYNEDPNMLYEEESLIEFFARIMRMPLCEEEKKELFDEDKEEDEDEEIKTEFSGAGAVGGYALPLGASNKTKEQEAERIKKAAKFFGGGK